MPANIAPLALLAALLASSPALAQQVQSPSAPAPAAPSHQIPPAISVLGADVRNQDGKTIGRIVDVLVGTDGHPRAAVVDFGGFMGVGARRVAIEWSELRFSPDGAGPALLGLTPDQLRAAPDYTGAGPVSVVGTPHPLAPATQPEPAAPKPTTPPAQPGPALPTIITPAVVSPSPAAP